MPNTDRMPFILRSETGEQFNPRQAGVGAESVDILADDGRALYTLRLLPGGELEISTGSVVKAQGVVLEEALTLSPQGSGRIVLARKPYKG